MAGGEPPAMIPGLSAPVTLAVDDGRKTFSPEGFDLEDMRVAVHFLKYDANPGKFAVLINGIASDILDAVICYCVVNFHNSIWCFLARLIAVPQYSAAPAICQHNLLTN